MLELAFFHHEAEKMSKCYCGQARSFETCCAPLIRGERIAATPELLMRSRFTAYHLGEAAYLLATWHPETRPSELDLSDSPAWHSLRIISSKTKKERGQVKFRAFYAQASSAESARPLGYLQEESLFLKEAGRWFYHSALSLESSH
ncbi:YchJ family protein [Marinospirillum sp.]|uniref:YchJ family protein n=1 Tax=Marinospirillum sp. TaxID=2183934 RepID=UPI003A83DE82